MYETKTIMPFTIIRGTFHSELGIPDGDSVRFKPDNESLIRGLKRARKATIKKDGTAQLRYEGIDAIEKQAIQPFAADAKKKNLELLGVKPATPNPRGYILSRECEVNGRPVCFVFTGTPPGPDGSSFVLQAPLLRKSVNVGIVRQGYAYPLFYKTLFAELRVVIVEALHAAQKAPSGGLGYWPVDRTNKGFKVTGKADKDKIKPIFPKLWRRLFSDFKSDPADLNAFLAFIAGQNERLHTLSDGRFIAFNDVLKVTNGKLRMTYKPEDIVFEPK
jgi:endonuclease YncB( thermonuclease family)